MAICWASWTGDELGNVTVSTPFSRAALTALGYENQSQRRRFEEESKHAYLPVFLLGAVMS